MFTDRLLRDGLSVIYLEFSPRRISPAKFQIAIAVVIVVRRRCVSSETRIPMSQRESSRVEKVEAERETEDIIASFFSLRINEMKFRSDLCVRLASSYIHSPKLTPSSYVHQMLSAILSRPVN